MSGPVISDPDSLPPTHWQGLLVVCDRFEAAWRTAQEPRIEDYLGEAPAADLSTLLHELLALELELRRDRGENPTPEEYHARFPGHAELIGSVFDATDPPDPHSTPPIARAETCLPLRAACELPERFGRYQILRCLGRGGMGAVYLAHDRAFDRRVALKVPFFTPADGPLALERFLREARAAATLSHPNLCPIHHIGQIDRIHYLTMAYIEGSPLSALLRAGRPFAPRKAVALVRTLALALAELHTAGVIHRDLKPANIMITRNGTPVIVDFGLARRLRKPDPRLTVSGAMIGTPAYMPPEQLQGRVAAMGPGCDVYSLGLIFYELLAGRRPFLGSTAEIVGQILHVMPESPSAHNPGLDPRLAAICLKAMAREIADRYMTMSDLAAALNEYLVETKSPRLHDSPITPPSRFRRSRVAALAAGAAVLGLLGLRYLPVGSPAPSRVRANPGRDLPAASNTRHAPPSIAKNTSAPPVHSSVEQVQFESRENEDSEIARFSEEISRLSDKIDQNSDDIVSYNDRGNAYLDRGKVWSTKGLAARANDDFDHAIADYDKAIGLAPKTAGTYFNRGNAFFEKREFARAIADYAEAIRLRPGDSDFYTNRGNAYVKSGDYDRAIQDYDAAIGIKPDDFKPFVGRGLAYEKKGDTARASADHEQAKHLGAPSAASQSGP
jgi:serine/threonine protein kinase